MSLPDQFSDLERFTADWDLPDTNSRYTLRVNSSFEALCDFHGAIAPRFEEIVSYLEVRDMTALDEADTVLARLMLAYAVVAPGVESFRQPIVPDCESLPMFNVISETTL